jgi:hypothetical protein
MQVGLLPTHITIVLPSTVPLSVSVGALSGKNGAYIICRASSITCAIINYSIITCQEKMLMNQNSFVIIIEDKDNTVFSQTLLVVLGSVAEAIKE